MPPLSDYAEWLVSIARRIGFGSADVPTGYVAINAWCDIGVDLTLWERETVKALSDVFISAFHKYHDDAEALPPWMPPGQRELLEEQIAMFDDQFGALAADSSARKKG